MFIASPPFSALRRSFCRR